MTRVLIVEDAPMDRQLFTGLLDTHLELLYSFLLFP